MGIPTGEQAFKYAAGELRCKMHIFCDLMEYYALILC